MCLVLELHLFWDRGVHGSLNVRVRSTVKRTCSMHALNAGWVQTSDVRHLEEYGVPLTGVVQSFAVLYSYFIMTSLATVLCCHC
jgi:hypothetical protein